MSEEIDYDTNGLCINVTEDAFEQFQATSMQYQEEEITLPLNGSTCADNSFDSKIECPEVEVVSSTIEDNIQIDECLPNVFFSCSTESEEDLHIIKNVPDTQNLELCPTNDTELNSSTSEVLDNHENTNDCNISQNVSKKKGRKKKTNSTKAADNESVIIQDSRTKKRNRSKRNPGTSGTLDNESKNIIENNVPIIKTKIRNKRLPKRKQINTNTIGSVKQINTNTIGSVNSEKISPEIIPQIPDLSSTIDPKIVNDNVENGKETIDTSQNISCDIPVIAKTKKSVKRKGRPRGKGSRKGGVKRVTASDLSKEVVSVDEAISCKNNEIEMVISNDQINEIKKDSSDEEDNECLSKLKTALEDNMNKIVEADKEKALNLQDDTIELEDLLTPSKRNIKNPMMEDYEYNIDSVVKESEVESVNAELESSVIEDITTRPSRRQARKTLQYHDESDEDPFANMDTSEEDEPKRGKYRYYSDDEYIPGKKRGSHRFNGSSEEDFDDELQEVKKAKRRKSKVGKSPTKAKKLATEESNKSVTIPSGTSDDTLCEVVDIENQIQTTIIGNTEKSDKVTVTQSWGKSKEFENFLAKKIQGSQLKIKKISTASEANNSLTPLEIPVIDPKEIKKSVDVHAQTDRVKTTNFWTQTGAPSAVKMKDNVDLTQKQSENACEFLKSVFTKTSGLGQLMTKKSDAFVEKKINSSYVKDTFRIDCCIEKTFLLLKLAKNEIQQMEDNLATEYEQFLEKNNLAAYKEEEKKIKPRLENNDSDCEIVETPIEQSKSKPKFNPKTVFLNKELSIKIAKKPFASYEPQENKINIKGKSAVWLNKSIMVKKIKPTQSFLAQDSRNKKPPDSYVTYKMVNDFFKSYFRQQAVKICTPFINATDCLTASRNNVICNYFFVKQGIPSCVQNGDINNADDGKTTNTLISYNIMPQSLSSLCFAVLRKHMLITEHKQNSKFRHSDLVVDDKIKRLDIRTKKSISPFNGVTNELNETCIPKKGLQTREQSQLWTTTIQKLSLLCMDVLNISIQKVQVNDQMVFHTFNVTKTKNTLCRIMRKKLESTSPITSDVNENFPPNNVLKNIEQLVLPTSQIQSLSLLCLGVLKTQLKATKSEVPFNVTKTKNKLCRIMRKKLESTNPITSDVNENFSPNNVLKNVEQLVLPTSQIQSLSVLCLGVLKTQLKATKSEVHTSPKNKIVNLDDTDTFHEKNGKCIQILNGFTNVSNEKYPTNSVSRNYTQSIFSTSKLNTLLVLCLEVLKKQMQIIKNNEQSLFNKFIDMDDIDILNEKIANNASYFNEITSDSNENYFLETDFQKVKQQKDLKPQNLSSICLDVLIKQMRISMSKDLIALPSLYVSAEDKINNEKDFQNLEQSVLHLNCNNDTKISNKSPNIPDTLKHISFTKLRNLLDVNKLNQIAVDELSNSANNDLKTLFDICFQYVSTLVYNNSNSLNTTGTTIGVNDIDTLSDQAFLDIVDGTNLDVEDDIQYSDDGLVTNNDGYESDCNNQDKNDPMENNWVSQVQMEALTSYDPCSNVPEGDPEDENILSNQTLVSQVKIEPEDLITNIKVETEFSLGDISIIPDSVCTKQELEYANVSVNLDSFENFVSANKLMLCLNESDTIFSQSADRIRRQHAPDSDDENDYDMSLLVPHTFEPLQLSNAKESLMDSSSENEENQLIKKKKLEKRSRGRPRKLEMKNNNKIVTSVDKVLEKPPVNNDISIITRRMKERIRQDAKKNVSSDSENEIITRTKRSVTTNCEQGAIETEENTRTMQKKQRQEKKNIESSAVSENDNLKETKNKDKEKSNNQILTRGKKVNDAIQYAEVDSTETADIESHDNKNKIESNKMGSNALDDSKNENDISDVINYDDPVELLECEPTLPTFEDEYDIPTSKTTTQKKSLLNKLDQTKKSLMENKVNYIERHGWHCYPLDANDEKVYGIAQILLEKLSDEFVDTYNKYLEISVKDREDAEVDRLINLQSLNRVSNIGEKKCSLKDKVDGENKSTPALDTNFEEKTYDSDHYSELTPSEDEDEGVQDQIPLEQPLQQTDNHLAKNSLMNDEESDAESSVATKDSEKRKRDKSLLMKIKGIKKEDEQGELMLTADKMMNKELTMLHAPVDLKKEISDDVHVSPPKNDKKREDVKKKQKSSKGETRHNHEKSDDSSSEEEKLWVNTKEKLLKRMGKRQEDTSIEDAKRTKITNEFIVRRSDADLRKPKSVRGRSRRSYKKFLEHQKQLRVLSHELFGENSAQPGKKYSQSYARGRRNIRKVIDKKSLARSTVIANMEEFERKRRLNTRQHKLQEVLGVEEDVNVVVINDEVCLEYDFVTQQPVVTIHPFFTKVMKAHQYEGVKFMWDACFESLSMIHSGQVGGGCILAHCMGLGKTLQVLALLHTVMTHPQVGVKRVLVCCPLSTVLNWVDEIHKWIGPVTNKIKVFELSKLKKTYERAYQLEDWYNGGGIFIIGYELFRSLSTLDPDLDNVRPTIVNKIRTALLDPGPDIIVCDEGHLLKNDCSVLAVAMSRVATKRRIILTGTPMQNNLREYYCMVNFVKPNLLGTYSEYSNRFENPIMNGQHRDSREEDIRLMKARTHILHKVLEGCLQRQEASVLYPYLPKKHEYTVFISLTKCQWDLYKHYMNNYARTNSRQSVLKDFHTLQKIWSHPQVLHNFHTKARENSNQPKVEKVEDELAVEDMTAAEDVKPPTTEVWWLPYLDGGDMLNTLEASNKFVAVFKILDECVQLGDKVLIFSTSLFTMDSLEYFLKKIKNWSLGTDYYRLDGSVPAEVRQKWCREFNAENNFETKLFLISTRAGCLGLNMVAANRVVILDTSWNPAHDVQSIFRVYRFGQKKDCFIYRLVALGTMEQKIYERAVTKQAVACRVVDEQQIDRHYNMSDLMELYRYDESGLGVAGGVAVGVQDVALLRVARLRALHAVHEHDSLLRGSHERDLPEHERAAAWMQFQQEQAHTHFQNQLGMYYTPTTRPHGHDYAKATVVIPPPSTSVQTPIPTIHTSIPEIKQEDTSEQLTEPKKFIAFKQCIIPLERLPEIPKEKPPKIVKASQSNDDLDETKVKKITNLLIKYDFHTKPPKEIANLVGKVRNIVSSNQLDVLKESNELIKSIAYVMLGKDNPVDFEDAIDSEVKTKTESVLPEKKVRSNKRKAALSAQKMISYQDPTVISVIDSSDEEWTPNRGETSKAPVVERSQQDTEEVKRAVASLFNNTDSILLSDDEEPPRLIGDAEASENIDEEDNQNVFLHPSLLSNENFIKIVAHTYLSGNPMLDEDAAILAANYSTGKVRAEYESTGKPITSGPIYDIAVKVLGKEVMKKLHDKEPPKKPTAPAPEQRYKPGPKSKKAKITPTAEPTKAAPKVKMGFSRPKTANNHLDNSGYATEEATKVVPVSMFKGAGNILTIDSSPDPGGECILPDDDFCTVDSNPTPPPLIRKNSKPLVINTVVSKGGNSKGPVGDVIYVPAAQKTVNSTGTVEEIVYVPAAQKTIPIAPQPLIKTMEFTGGKLIMANSSGENRIVADTSTNQTAPVVYNPAGQITNAAPILPVMSTTISLDSDDEETILPTILPKLPASSLPPTILNTSLSNPVVTPLLSSPVIKASIPTTANSSQSAPVANIQPLLFQPIFKASGLPIQTTPKPGSKNFIMVPKSQIDSLRSATSSAEASKIIRNLLQNQTPAVSVPPPLGIISQPIAASQTVIQTPNTDVMTAPVITSEAIPTSVIVSGTLPPTLTQISALQSRSTSKPSPSTSTAQSQPTPKQITTSTSAKSKVNFKCKPGDILRISATGELQVLKSQNDAANSDNSANAANSDNSANAAKKEIASATKPVEKNDKKKTILLPMIPTKQRSASPDPLAILKDVVHIRADAYETPPVKLKTYPSCDKAITKVAEPASAKTVTKSQDSKAQNVQESKNSVFTKARLKLEALMKNRAKVNTSTKPSVKKTSSSSPLISESTVNKKVSIVGRIIDTVDLTDVQLPSTSKSNANKSSSELKMLSQKKSSTITGTSKSIVIGGSGKLVSKPIISKDSPIKQTINLTKTISKPIKMEAVKRPAPHVRPIKEIKKKKTESEMTLKDFDIEDLSDLEDIIELE